MPGDFGSYLKSERELRGISLEEISEVTKVRLSFLQAIEKNEFDSFPGEVFIKGYIRSYANAIGSDVDEVLNIYDDEIGRGRKERLFVQSKKALEASDGNGGFLKFLLSLVGLVAVGAGVYFVFYNLPSSEKLKVKSVEEVVEPVVEAVKEPAISKPSPAPLEAEVDSAIEKLQPENNAKVETVSPAPIATVTDDEVLKPESKLASKLKVDENIEDLPQEEPVETPVEGTIHSLNIQADEESWFHLKIDGLEEKQFTLPAGASKQFSGSNSFQITIGNRAGSKLTLNGKPLVLPKGYQNVVRDFIINPKKEE